MAIVRNLSFPRVVAEDFSTPSLEVAPFYVHDPEAKGFGIHVVVWFGDKDPWKGPMPPNGKARPAASLEMILAHARGAALRACPLAEQSHPGRKPVSGQRTSRHERQCLIGAAADTVCF